MSVTHYWSRMKLMKTSLPSISSSKRGRGEKWFTRKIQLYFCSYSKRVVLLSLGGGCCFLWLSLLHLPQSSSQVSCVSPQSTVPLSSSTCWPAWLTSLQTLNTVLTLVCPSSGSSSSPLCPSFVGTGLSTRPSGTLFYLPRVDIEVSLIWILYRTGWDCFLVQTVEIGTHVDELVSFFQTFINTLIL